MKNAKFLIFIFFFQLSATISARTEVIKDLELNFSVPTGWKVDKNLYGLAIVLLGPKSSFKRPVIGITNTHTNKILAAKLIKKELSIYKSARKKWVLSNGGSSIAWIPLKTFTTSNKVEIHQLGHRYQLGNDIFIELSQYLNCSGRLVHIKSLFGKNDFKRLDKINKKILESVSCKIL